jgi:hypothetical protein
MWSHFLNEISETAVFHKKPGGFVNGLDSHVIGVSLTPATVKHCSARVDGTRLTERVSYGKQASAPPQYDVIVTMDDELQHPPEEIPALLSKLEEGFDVVYGMPQREPSLSKSRACSPLRSQRTIPARNAFVHRNTLVPTGSST